uniref:Uncharacterized protein n=1 Tax=Timema shepardi TaxID=629360 RepID=A0A7R9AZ44_TIMSH|nr:unnamed protein product [Timema shepardi]
MTSLVLTDRSQLTSDSQHLADSMSLSSPPGTSVQSPRDFDKLSETPLPTEVQQLPENLQNLLLGRVASIRTNNKTRKIVIYICAADSQDCCVEKGSLHNTVYPELRAYCHGRGYELHIVDLHWKTGLEKQQDHEFPELCLGELSRQMEVAYVIPVLFLSNSLGTPLLPNTIENQDFEMAVKTADNKELLQKWYKLDSHAQPPCYRLQPISSHIPGFKENSPEEKDRALSEWRSEIERTLAVMVNVFPQELRDTYLTTVVEQEVHNTVFMSQELARRCLWLYRVFTQGNPSPEQTSPGDHELKRRLNILQKDLKVLDIFVCWSSKPSFLVRWGIFEENWASPACDVTNQLNDKHILRIPVRWVEGGLNINITEHTQYVTEVTSHLTKHLRASIDNIIEEDQAKAVLKSCYGIDCRLLQELMQQTNFCQRAAQCSINREDVLQDIKSYIIGESNCPLVVCGPRGCGKSTLLARAAQCCHSWQPEGVLVTRFVGVSPYSSTAEQLLHSITNQCSVVTHGFQTWDTHVCDYGTQSIDWLPVKLPENVKLILSVTHDSPTFTDLEGRLKDTAAFIKMPTLGKAEAQAILMASVMQYNHSVNSRIQDCVRSSVQDCTLPLYVKVEHALALATVSKMGVCDSEMLDLLAHDPNFHSKDTYVSWAPGCLFWAGLNKYLAPFLRWSGVAGPSTLRWRDSLLFDAINNKYSMHHSWARQMLIDYYQGKLTNDKGSEMAGRQLPQPNKTDSCYNQHKLDELPYQNYHLHKSIKQDFLFNHSWLYDKLCGSNVFQVLEDIILEEKVTPNPEKDLVQLRKFLEESATALIYDGRQFYSQMYGQLSSLFSLDDSLTPGTQTESNKHFEAKKKMAEEYPFLASLYETCRSPPIASLIPIKPLVGVSSINADTKNGAGEKLENEILGDDLAEVRFDLVTRLGDSPDFVVTVSTEREEISVWDVHSATPVRTLVGVTHPINLKAIDEHRCVVLCRRELRTYDLDTGSFVTRLKGVMNQKMPYYGLHDKVHLVALSRNRMYVNLMNLESGDCVTTFKAGEDRFLNSLLVSGDGRVLVCGDETQKPFPLLVWNLASRKLLYDLRIPHHDFQTNLAAITHEGHYVCCVAKEVDEPSANFIVVYDLQSGTLFKKWKPGVNTVSLDISSRDGCVISGLEDSRILVWDLITGLNRRPRPLPPAHHNYPITMNTAIHHNYHYPFCPHFSIISTIITTTITTRNCRWSLCGHTAPVNFLRLDALGGSFLSADSSCRDRSLRLWDLNKGSLLAVYTPERPITSCEVTSGGRSVVLALRGRSNITTLQLRGPNIGATAVPPLPARCYGHPEHTGKIFTLRDQER